MKKTAMKAYMDGNNRLIIIIDEPGAGLTDLVRSFLGGSIPEVQHLGAPAPMATPDIDTSGMKEMSPAQPAAKPAKFIRNKETAESVAASSSTAEVLPPPDADKNPEHTMPRKATENNMSVDGNTAIREMNVQLIECMTVFELQDYLRSRSGDQKLVAILTEQVHAPLDFVLHTKSEREIRAIAQKLAN